MKKLYIVLFLLVALSQALLAQTLDDARQLYLKGEFQKALPVFEAEYNVKPTDANLNQWYGVCLYETGGSLDKAEECLLLASKKNIQDSFLYLGRLYAKQYRFDEATASFDEYEAIVTKNSRRKKKDELEKEAILLEKLEADRKILSRLQRMVHNVEDVQIIDSLVVDKANFLSAYKLSVSSGRLDYFNEVFDANQTVNSTVYFNEKETKIYFGQPDTSSYYSLFSMEKLLDKFANEKRLSPTNFGLRGNVNYPFIMPDGVTVYFSAQDEESIGGYDLFVTRYNMNNDTYLSPERMNMPFNSQANDYLMVVDEEKGVGWFASDRFQPEGKVCVYTYIPNSSVKIIESDDDQYKKNRALISSIQDTWADGVDYTKLIKLARKESVKKEVVVRDFVFVLNDKFTYYFLTDFKNKDARNTYANALNLKKELKSTTEELDKKRDDYAKTQDNNLKRNMSNSILELERKTENLEKEIYKLEIEARRLEHRGN